MNWWRTIGIGVGLVCAGCATHLEQPSLSEATMVPRDLKPEEAALITVKVDDTFGVVSRVQGTVLEDATIRFHFRDDGQLSDAVAEDGIWTTKVKAPFNAPPGGFTFEIQAFDKDSNPIVVLDENKEAMPLSMSFTLSITYPDADAETETETDADTEADTP